MARSRSHFTNLDLKKPNLLLSMCPWTSWTNAFEWLIWKWQHQSGRTSRDSNCSGSIGKTWLNSYLWHAFPCQNSPKQCDLARLLHGIQKAWKEAKSTVLLFLSAWRWHNTHQNWGFFEIKNAILNTKTFTHQGSVLEGMYWKRRMEAVCAQYKRWRGFNSKKKRCCRKRARFYKNSTKMTLSNLGEQLWLRNGTKLAAEQAEKQSANQQPANKEFNTRKPCFWTME